MSWFHKVKNAPRPAEPAVVEPFPPANDNRAPANSNDLPKPPPKIEPDPDKPLIICPCHSRVHPGTVQLISELQYRHRWEYRPWYGATGVDRVRSQAASEALTRPQKYWFWCDDDNFLPVRTVRKLWHTMQERDLDVLAAVVPVRRANCRPNFAPINMDVAVALGAEGGPVLARSAGLALAFTHRRVFERLIELERQKTAEAEEHRKALVDLLELSPDSMPYLKATLCLADSHIAALKFALANWYQPDLPVVDYNTAYTEQILPGWPFFRPLLNPETRSHYGEDYSFCQRVLAAGMQIWVDTSAIAWHATEQLLTLGDIVQQFQADEQQRIAAWHDSAELI